MVGLMYRRVCIPRFVSLGVAEWSAITRSTVPLQQFKTQLLLYIRHTVLCRVRSSTSLQQSAIATVKTIEWLDLTMVKMIEDQEVCLHLDVTTTMRVNMTVNEQCKDIVPYLQLLYRQDLIQCRKARQQFNQLPLENARPLFSCLLIAM